MTDYEIFEFNDKIHFFNQFLFILYSQDTAMWSISFFLLGYEIIAHEQENSDRNKPRLYRAGLNVNFMLHKKWTYFCDVNEAL